MNTSALEQELVTQLAVITDELKTIGTHDADSDNWEAVPDTGTLNEVDENLEADAVESWNERRATLTVLEIEYRNIKRALGKMAAGTYGICEVSGEIIEPDRLAVKPSARTCVAHMDEESRLSL